MAADMQATLVCLALHLAAAKRQLAPSLIVHSNRGAQDSSAAHQALLAQHGLVSSVSCKGNCRDNAVMERFLLDLEMVRIWQRGCADHTKTLRGIDIDDYIVNFYSSVRLQSTFGN